MLKIRLVSAIASTLVVAGVGFFALDATTNVEQDIRAMEAPPISDLVTPTESTLSAELAEMRVTEIVDAAISTDTQELYSEMAELANLSERYAQEAVALLEQNSLSLQTQQARIDDAMTHADGLLRQIGSSMDEVAAEVERAREEAYMSPEFSEYRERVEKMKAMAESLDRIGTE